MPIGIYFLNLEILEKVFQIDAQVKKASRERAREVRTR